MSEERNRDYRRDDDDDLDFSEEQEDERGERFGRRRGPVGRGRRARSFYAEQLSKIPRLDYKDLDTLRQFITDRGKIRPRRQTGISAKQQRMVARAIKRARHMALLPFVNDSAED